MQRVQELEFVDLAKPLTKEQATREPKAMSRRQFLRQPAWRRGRHFNGAGSVRAQLHRSVRSGWSHRTLSESRTSSSSTSASSTSSATRRFSGCITARMWAEGPAWNGVGRYLLWSDIPNNVQLRWLEEDGHVSASAIRPATATATRSTTKAGRFPSSTAPAASCATNYNGSFTVLADKFGRQRLQRPQRRRRASRRRHLVHRSRLRQLDELRRERRTPARVQPIQKEAVYRIDARPARSRR